MGRICVVLTGQLRQFQKAFEANRWIIEREDLDLIICTWSQRGNKTGGAMGINQIKRLIPREILYGLPFELYGSRFFEIQGIRDLFKNELESDSIVSQDLIHRYAEKAGVHIYQDDDYCQSLSNKAHAKGIDVNQFYMMRLWANGLAKVSEKCIESGTKYDLVIRARPDLIFDDVVDEYLLRENENLVLTDWVDHVGSRLGDSLSVFSSRSMDYIRDAYFHLINGEDAWKHHETLYAYMSDGMLDIEQVNNTPVIADECLSSEIILNHLNEVALSSAGMVKSCALSMMACLQYFSHDADITHSIRASLIAYPDNISAHLLRSLHSLELSSPAGGPQFVEYSRKFLSILGDMLKNNIDGRLIMHYSDFFWEETLRPIRKSNISPSKFMGQLREQISDSNVFSDFYYINSLLEGFELQLAAKEFQMAWNKLMFRQIPGCKYLATKLE